MIQFVIKKKIDHNVYIVHQAKDPRKEYMVHRSRIRPLGVANCTSEPNPDGQEQNEEFLMNEKSEIDPHDKRELSERAVPLGNSTSDDSPPRRSTRTERKSYKKFF